MCAFPRACSKGLAACRIFGWCGSAALGGYLADLKGYSFTFFITAAIQACATLLQALLILIVPRFEKPATADPTKDPTKVTTQPLTASLEAGGAAHAVAAEGSIQ